MGLATLVLVHFGSPSKVNQNRGLIVPKSTISKILRQKRKPSANGQCNDTARCIVRINGKKQYYSLGRFGSPESEAEYQRIKAQFEKEDAEHKANSKTSDSLYDAFAAECLQGENLTRDQWHDADAIRYARERFSPFYLDDFSMTYLVAFQSFLVRIAPETRYSARSDGKEYVQKRPWTRSYVNRIMKHYKRVLTWGINNGFISPIFRDSIRLFPGITAANARGLPESPRRESVRDSDVIAALPFMPTTVADMVRIQRAACLRPSEVCNLLVGDIIFTDSGAIVDKAKNKIARTGVHRHIAFGIAEANILLKYCAGRQDNEYVFSMRLSMKDVFEARRNKRKTPLTPSQQKRDSERSQTRLLRYSEHFDVPAYDNIVRRAVKKAMAVNPDVRAWTPYQLRHAAYSALSARYGVDVASKVAGHLSPNLARIYDHSAAEVSQRVASERTQLWTDIQE